MSRISTIAIATILEVLRGRASWVVVGLVIAGLVLAAFLQQVALVERADTQAILTGALLRLGAAFVVASIVVSGMVREANDKLTDLLLAQSMPRATYLFGRLAGYALSAVAITAVVALPLALFASVAHVASWAVALACELVIVVAVSVFCAITLVQFVPAFAASAGFYVLARSIDAIQAIATNPFSPASRTDALVAWTLDGIAVLLPPLHRMASSARLLDASPDWASLGGAVATTLAYLTLIVSAALVDLYRKNL